MKNKYAVGPYSWMLQQSVRKLYCLTIFVWALGMTIWWFGLYRPLATRSDYLCKEYNDLSVQHDEIVKAHQELPIVEKSITHLRNALTESMQLHGAHATQQAMSTLVEIAEKNGLRMQSCRLGKQKNESWCVSQEINAELMGTLEQHISFLTALKKSKQLISCNHCEISRKDAEQFYLHATFEKMIVTGK